MKNPLKYGILAYVLVQLLYLLWATVPFHNDSLRYFESARQCLACGSFYPCPQNWHDAYINAPVYVNYLILLLHIWDSSTCVTLANILLNLLQLWLLYKTTLIIFKHQGYATISALLYLCYLTNLGLVLLNLTELAFGVLILLTLYLYLKKAKIYWFSAGIALALATGVRPIGLALLLSLMTILLLRGKVEKRLMQKTTFLIMGFLATVMLLGLLSTYTFGRFIFISDTGAVNLIMGANDDATGAYNTTVFQPGKMGYIANEASIPYFEKSDRWYTLAFAWIKDHPLQWLSLFPAKMAYMFLWDDWAIYVLLDNDYWNLQVIGKMILENSSDQIFNGKTGLFKKGFTALYLIHHLYYFVLLFCMMYQFYFYRRNRRRFIRKRLLPLYLYVFYGLAMSWLTVGMARYKYPFMIMMLVVIAPLVGEYIKKTAMKIAA